MNSTIKNTIMTITANTLKTRGVSAIAENIDDFNKEVFISVRGEKKYAAIDMDYYKKLREFELEAAYLEAERDIANGDYHTSTERHIKEIKEELEKEKLKQNV